MENLDSTQTAEQKIENKKSGPLIIFIAAFLIVVIALWQFSVNKADQQPIETTKIVNPAPKEKPAEVVEVVEIVEVAPPAEEIEIVQVEEVVIVPPVIELPSLDESDDWIKVRLPEITWRNELLSLLINEDIVRRFVVFTDNFSQGLIAYEHSPFVQPKVKFSVDETQVITEGTQNSWEWNVQSTKRFDLYVDLILSVDTDTLVNWYFELKPLIDEAYAELGYSEDFTYTLQDAITRVLDMELPKGSMDITRPSVMYKYQNPALENLADSDKLLLRIGKENLLIIKSALLDINEKLTKGVKAKGYWL